MENNNEPELTPAQIERQDIVDNEIYNLLCTLIGKQIDWNIEEIGEVRDVIELIAKYHGIEPIDFYPYLEME